MTMMMIILIVAGIVSPLPSPSFLFSIFLKYFMLRQYTYFICPLTKNKNETSKLCMMATIYTIQQTLLKHYKILFYFAHVTITISACTFVECVPFYYYLLRSFVTLPSSTLLVGIISKFQQYKKMNEGRCKHKKKLLIIIVIIVGTLSFHYYYYVGINSQNKTLTNLLSLSRHRPFQQFNVFMMMTVRMMMRGTLPSLAAHAPYIINIVMFYTYISACCLSLSYCRHHNM